MYVFKIVVRTKSEGLRSLYPPKCRIRLTKDGHELEPPGESFTYKLKEPRVSDWPGMMTYPTLDDLRCAWAWTGCDSDAREAVVCEIPAGAKVWRGCDKYIGGRPAVLGASALTPIARIQLRCEPLE